ncbi:phenylalanine--tRNA ligase subunit beta [archaeon]|nr:phenylalanine--tRNA ligase subunit beta [archaeon]|tara:strand:+ start:3699 stop:5321 length:1623 start_codon:yes stop_codon:yes gene_type:complete
MPTVNLNKKQFETLVGKSLELDKLRDRISMLGTDLESIEGNEITVEIFPNRPDMLSEQGFARAFSSFIGIKKGLREYTAKKSNYEIIIDPSVKKVRPYTACAVVKNLKFNDENLKSIIQLQEKLHTSYGRNRRKVAIGVYPLEKIKFPIDYLALPPEKIKFTPLEYSEVMNAMQILTKTNTGREFAHLLEKETLYPIFRDKNNSILSMPPIINSNDSGKITETTKDVFIECSGFDLNSLKKCLNIIVTTLADIGGVIYETKLKYKKPITTPDLKPEKIKLNTNYVNKILGLSLSEKEIKSLLEKMGFNYNKNEVSIPPYRADILHEIDLIEDIAIAYGYENFEETIPNVATIGSESKLSKFKRKISEILIGLKFLETSTFSLSNKNNLNKKMNSKKGLTQVESPVNSDYDTLRSWMLPSLMQVLNTNKHYEYPQELFEIGTIFEDIKESQSLSIVKCEGNFTEIKQILDLLMSSLNLEYEIQEDNHSSFIEGRSGKIIIKEKNLGFLGELSPEVITNWDLELPVSALELNISKLFKILNS